jgi:hypothetical protein
MIEKGGEPLRVVTESVREGGRFLGFQMHYDEFG